MFLFYTLAQYYSDDQIKNREIGRACGTYGEQYRCIQGFGEVTLGKTNTLKTQA